MTSGTPGYQARTLWPISETAKPNAAKMARSYVGWS